MIYHGVDAAFRPPNGRSVADPPYLLYVGEYGPWKGYEEAFEVVARLADDGYPHRLKVAGRIAPWVRDRIEELVARCRRPERIELLGFVGHDGDLPSLYQGASLLVMTSRFESFGFPSVEAMACGTPVVAFRNSATEEIVADGGILVPDGDVGAFVAGVRSLLDSPERWWEVSCLGIERARAFDWGASVERHAELYFSTAVSP